MNAPIDDPADDRSLESRSRELFDASVASLDAGTRSRLNQARQAALDVVRSPTAGPVRWLVSVGSAAALGLVALTAAQFMRVDNGTPAVEAPNVVAGTVEDLEILTSSDDLEMLRNMEFYAWLETQPESALDDAASGEAG